MAHTYGSFLVRSWQSPDGAQRLQIEHLQSGDRAQVASKEAAVAWIGTRTTAPTARADRRSATRTSGTPALFETRID